MAFASQAQAKIVYTYDTSPSNRLSRYVKTFLRWTVIYRIRLARIGSVYIQICSSEIHLFLPTGAIIGVVFGVLFGVALIGFAGFMYIKQKR